MDWILAGRDCYVPVSADVVARLISEALAESDTEKADILRKLWESYRDDKTVF